MRLRLPHDALDLGHLCRLGKVFACNDLLNLRLELRVLANDLDQLSHGQTVQRLLLGGSCFATRNHRLLRYLSPNSRARRKRSGSCSARGHTPSSRRMRCLLMLLGTLLLLLLPSCRRRLLRPRRHRQGLLLSSWRQSAWRCCRGQHGPTSRGQQVGCSMRRSSSHEPWRGSHLTTAGVPARSVGQRAATTPLRCQR